MANMMIVEGSSEPFDFALKNNGSALNGNGIALALEIKKGSVTVADPPTVSWLDQPNGTVRVLGMDKLTLGQYRVRFKLTDASSRVAYAPNEFSADVWTVVKKL